MLRIMDKMRRGHRLAPLNQSTEGLRYALQQSGLTQRQLAAGVGKSESLISEVLKGTRNATPAVLARMAQVLNCPRSVIERHRDAAA